MIEVIFTLSAMMTVVCIMSFLVVLILCQEMPEDFLTFIIICLISFSSLYFSYNQLELNKNPLSAIEKMR